ncbi:hypothetical protein [Saccharothrix sp. ST-888]|uniref:hypothetical protein n=1 Tax=Saccharothrix sp. ST-888 TaxID=1427391 RepID=UPI000A635338|nr:hypothetical protein [Saccharothrix sp. ST-888]
MTAENPPPGDAQSIEPAEPALPARRETSLARRIAPYARFAVSVAALTADLLGVGERKRSRRRSSDSGD